MLNLVQYPSIISTRVTTNVGDPYLDAFQFEFLMFWKFCTYKMAINISIDSSGGGYFSELIHDFNTSNIAGMPNFITVFEML